MPKRQRITKMLVILPSGDFGRVEREVSEGRYVTKSDFVRSAIKQLLDKERSAAASEYKTAKAETVITRRQILETLDANMERIGKLGAKRIGLFGSYERGEQGPESDIDILVEFSSGRKSFHNYMRLKLLLEGIFKRKVDLVIKEAVRSELKEKILKSVAYAQGL